MEQGVRALRVFVLYPAMNSRVWRVMLPGTAQFTFDTEWDAVEYALAKAASLKGSGRPVEVLKERVSGDWAFVPC